MKRISVNRFSEQCLQILDNLHSDGIVVTKDGKDVAKLIPIKSKSSALIGSMRGKIKITGDIFSTRIK
jgi:antitoxin (DNA-binding transcriptional repressor) of toxin-antitoxin stability system